MAGDIVLGVARRARAWIETRAEPNERRDPRSPAARGRGLKLGPSNTIYLEPESPAARGRGLKRLDQDAVRVGHESPAARGRGLKPPIDIAEILDASRPPRAGVD